MQIVIVIAETIVGSLWSVVNLKQGLLLFCIFFTRYFSKRQTRIDVLLINFPASALFYSRCKVSEILSNHYHQHCDIWCRPYIFFRFNFGSTLSLRFFFQQGAQAKAFHARQQEDRPLSCLICHETQISITNGLNRTLCPKIWASYCSAEYCPRMQKTHFRLTCVRLKTSFKLTIKMLNNINMQNVVSQFLLFLLDLPNLRQGQGS